MNSDANFCDFFTRKGDGNDDLELRKAVMGKGREELGRHSWKLATSRDAAGRKIVV